MVTNPAVPRGEEASFYRGADKIISAVTWNPCNIAYKQPIIKAEIEAIRGLIPMA